MYGPIKHFKFEQILLFLLLFKGKIAGEVFADEVSVLCHNVCSRLKLEFSFFIDCPIVCPVLKMCGSLRMFLVLDLLVNCVLLLFLCD